MVAKSINDLYIIIFWMQHRKFFVIVGMQLQKLNASSCDHLHWRSINAVIGLAKRLGFNKSANGDFENVTAIGMTKSENNILKPETWRYY